MKFINTIKTKVAGIYEDVVLHWNRPAKGNSVPYKEILNYALGGMGQHMVTYLLAYMALSASNTLLGSTIGIRPLHLQYMSIAQTFIGIIFYVLRGKWVDNTRTRYGRFRPYIALMGFPLVALSLIFLFLPFDRMTYTDKFIWVFVFSLAIAMLQPLFTDTYSELGSVLSDNSDERARIMTISILISSLAPTIYGTAIPYILDWTGLTYTDIDTYRYIIAAVAILGVGMSLFTAIGCKERVITSKTYVQKVGLWESISAVYKNKYWWIRTIASIIGFLETGVSVIFGWMYIYGTQNMAEYGTLTLIYGTSSTIAMLITPLLLRKLGNRGVLIFHNASNILCVALMLLTYKVPLLFFVCLYANTVFNQLQLVYNPVLGAEVKDYQQYLTGKRVDFILGAAGTITVPITLATGLVIPFVYEAMGVTTNYDILYDPQVRNNMFNMLCVLSIAGATLNLIPFFFYRLSREKHMMIITVLHRRAAFADYANGVATPEQIVETVEGQRRIEEIARAATPDLKAGAAAIRFARALPKRTEEEKSARKAAVKEAKKHYAELKTLRENKEAYDEIYLAEENKFLTPENALKISIYSALSAYRAEELLDVDFDKLEGVSVPEGSDKESLKLQKVYKKERAKFNKMLAAVKKRYGANIPTDCMEKVEIARAMPIEDRKQIIARDKALDVAEKALLAYNQAFGYYYAGMEFLAESENRKFYPEMVAKYEESLEEVSEKERLAVLKEQEERERKRNELEEERQKRFESFSKEKQARILARRRKKEEKARLAAQNAQEEQGAVLEAACAQEEEGGNE